MDFDAIVLAGGRGRRLGGVPKEAMRRAGSTLLELALLATTGAQNVVVVGDVAAAEGYRVAREDPPYSGPVSAIAAGLAVLRPESSPLTLVLACDMPHARAAVDAIHEQTASASLAGDGAIAVDGSGRDQYLLAIYTTRSLERRLASLTVENASMRRLVAGLTLDRVLAPAGSTADVDTWQDAADLGVTT